MRWFGANNDHASRLAFLLHFAAFLSGFVTMALEMLIGRTFIPYFGGTIYTWGALISVFLTGMTLGYMLGGKAADRWPDIPIVAALFLAAAALVVVVPLYGEDAINRILDSIDDMRYAALVASLALACLPAALYAAISPYCVRLLLDRKDHSGTISGRLSGLATAGSIVGTLGTSFFFIPTLGVRMIYGLLASASVVMGVILLLIGLSSYGQARSKKRPIVASIALCVALAAGATQVAAWADAVPLIAVKTQAGHTAVGINNYPGDAPNDWSGQFGRVVMNAARWLRPAITVSGGITNGDPIQTGRLFRGGVASECGAPNNCSTIAGNYHYTAHTFVNTSGAQACITTTLTTACEVVANQIFAAAYLNSFNPADICANNIGDGGLSPTGAPLTFDFTVPAGATFIVVVAEVTADGGCPAYTLDIAGLCRIAPTPTSAVSRKIHGVAGTFDINMPLAGPIG